jgi:hypothetical protein
MPKAPDKAAALSEEMLDLLDSQRKLGSPAYPTTLRRLGELCGGAPSEEEILKAATKQAFTKRAVVTEKVDKKPSLDAPVYFKEDAPPKKRAPAPRKRKDDIPELAEKMYLVLESQRRLGAEAYPPTLRRLAELCDLNASDNRVTKAAGHKAFAERAVVAAKEKSKPLRDAPVILRSDIEGGLTMALPALLRFALATVTARVKGKPTETTAFTPSEAKMRLVPELRERLVTALEREIERQSLPEGVAWVVTKGKRYLFLVENLRPSGSPPSRPAVSAPTPTHRTEVVPVPPAHAARDFAGAFRAAFEQLDRRNGSTNFVKLFDLRRALAEFSRDEFDSGLRKLRVDNEFSLDSHEGLYGSLTPEEREAGIHEAGSLLIYVSRR